MLSCHLAAAIPFSFCRAAEGLVELHGGRLDVASTPGCGTTVTVTFPPSRSRVKAAEDASATIV